MYMPLMIDVERAVVFGGERDEGLQKTEKMAVFADELLVVPESEDAPSEIRLGTDPLTRVPESLSLDKPRSIPVASSPANENNIAEYVSGATFVTSDLEDETLNRMIYEACEDRNILCNVIDVKEYCNTWLISVIDEENMIAGVSTRGDCAFYSQRTRIELEEEFRKRSEIARVFTELRDELRDEQCQLCALSIVYQNDDVQELIEEEKWDDLLRVGAEQASEVPDDYHVKDHSIPGPQ